MSTLIIPTVRLTRRATTERDAQDRRGQRVWVVNVDGRDVGIVGDVLPWRGARFGALRWWSALRDTTDWSTPATWNTGDVDLSTRKAALDALLAQLATQPAPAIRIAIDADCPRCGYGERFFDPARGVFGCSSLNSSPCGYESSKRDA